MIYVFIKDLIDIYQLMYYSKNNGKINSDYGIIIKEILYLLGER